MPPRQRKRIILSGLVFAMVLALVTLVVLRLRPPIPAEWYTIKPGMTRKQVEASIPDALIYLREDKGFDSANRNMANDYVWVINLFYDSQGAITSAEVRLVHQKIGFLGRSTEKLF